MRIIKKSILLFILESSPLQADGLFLHISPGYTIEYNTYSDNSSILSNGPSASIGFHKVINNSMGINGSVGLYYPKEEAILTNLGDFEADTTHQAQCISFRGYLSIHDSFDFTFASAGIGFFYSNHYAYFPQPVDDIIRRIYFGPSINGTVMYRLYRRFHLGAGINYDIAFNEQMRSTWGSIPAYDSDGVIHNQLEFVLYIALEI